MGDEVNTDSIASKMMDILPTIRTINEQFKDPVRVLYQCFSLSVPRYASMPQNNTQVFSTENFIYKTCINY